MHKTPAIAAGVSDQLPGDPGIPSANRPILKASRRAEARLRMLLRFFPWMLAKRRRIA